MKETDERTPAFEVNQPVIISGKDATYTVSAVFQLESQYIYELSHLHDFLVKERRLRSAELDTVA